MGPMATIAAATITSADVAAAVNPEPWEEWQSSEGSMEVGDGRKNGLRCPSVFSARSSVLGLQCSAGEWGGSLPLQGRWKREQVKHPEITETCTRIATRISTRVSGTQGTGRLYEPKFQLHCSPVGCERFHTRDGLASAKDVKPAGAFPSIRPTAPPTPSRVANPLHPTVIPPCTRNLSHPNNTNHLPSHQMSTHPSPPATPGCPPHLCALQDERVEDGHRCHYLPGGAVHSAQCTRGAWRGS